MNTFEFTTEQWSEAKLEAKYHLSNRAKVRGMMPYSELVSKINAISLEAHDQRLNEFLRQISIEEEADGRGLLSVVVVHKKGDMQPGPGFFELAKELGRNTNDILKCWITELNKVHAYWSIP